MNPFTTMIFCAFTDQNYFFETAFLEGDSRLQVSNPDQSFARQLNPRRGPNNKDDSKYKVVKLMYDNVPYWCSYDILGRFLSLIGPSSQGSHQGELLLAAVYYVLALVLADRHCGAVFLFLRMEMQGQRAGPTFSRCNTWGVRCPEFGR